MKTILFIFLVINLNVHAQEDSICLERGHAWSELMFTTDMYCGDPYILDEENASYMVYPRCNYHTRVCLRCGTTEQFIEEDIKVKIWERPKELVIDTIWIQTTPYYINLEMLRDSIGRPPFPILP